MGAVGLAENIATQPSLAGAWPELGNIGFKSEGENTGADKCDGCYSYF